MKPKEIYQYQDCKPNLDLERPALCMMMMMYDDVYDCKDPCLCLVPCKLKECLFTQGMLVLLPYVRYTRGGNKYNTSIV